MYSCFPIKLAFNSKSFSLFSVIDTKMPKNGCVYQEKWGHDDRLNFGFERKTMLLLSVTIALRRSMFLTWERLH